MQASLSNGDRQITGAEPGAAAGGVQLRATTASADAAAWAAGAERSDADGAGVRLVISTIGSDRASVISTAGPLPGMMNMAGLLE
jgi:hypothetical protein